jgi:AraC family transcriptional regulator, regulatory protein of adaptative response / methylated-DNA-[protein]-cysteine methyltransferase
MNTKRKPTKFEQRVYMAVRRIPSGKTRSYKWVAQQLGNQKLARAVGQALKRNPSPANAPCHRVIRSDGALGGYAWGISKKKRLLESESKARSA